MAQAFNGLNYGNIQNERFVEIILAEAAGTFSASAASFNPGLRTPATILRKTMTEQDVLERDIPQKSQFEITIDSLQTDIPALKNAYLLSKASTGFVGVRLKTEQGDYYNFIDNAAPVGSASGSSLMSSSWTYVVDDKSRKLSFKLTSNVEAEEYEWMLGTVSAASTSVGGTGSQPTLTATSYDRTKHYSPGFTKITVDGVQIGVFEAAKITLESVSFGKDNRERVLNTHVKATCEVTMRQTAATDLLASTQTGEYLEKEIKFYDYAGNTFTFKAGAVSINAEATKADKNAMVKLTLKGTFVNNVDEATPNCIDIGVTTPTDIAFTRIGY